MPEGHTIHRLARDHAAWFAGSAVRVTSPQGRFLGAEKIDGEVLVDTDAWGKHLFYNFGDGRIVHVHLGLFGKFTTHGDAPEPRDTVRMRLRGEDRTVDLTGATACELVTPGERDDIVERLGPDPIRRRSNPDEAWEALQRRRTGIGQALLDQAVLAGVGNVYRAEVLFVHGIHPKVPANEVERADFESIWNTLVRWLRRGVREKRIVTTDPDEIGVARSRMTREQARYVYKVETCKRCGSDIRRWNLAGRWAYACETCQPPP